MKSNVRNHKEIEFLAIWDLKSMKTVSRGMSFSRVSFRVIGWVIRVLNPCIVRKKTECTTCHFSLEWEKRQVILEAAAVSSSS